MKKYLLILLLTVAGYGQTLQNPTFGNTTTNTIKIKTPATVTSVNFLSTVEADGAVSKIDPVNLPFIIKKTISQIRSYSGDITNIYISDLGQEGQWYYDASDTTSADNTGTILVTADGKRIKRVASHTFSVKWFGAKGDGTTNDTGAIQNTIDYVYDHNGGVVYFPNGIYIVSGALQSPGSGFANVNSQLTIKNTSTGFLTVKLQGETPPAQVAGVLGSYTVNTSGVVINSTIQGSGLYPSILSTTGISPGYINGIGLYIENIEFRVKGNVSTGGANMSAVNASNILNVNIKSCFVGLDVSSNLSVYPTAETFGFYLPRTNLGQTSINDVAVTGLKVGYVFSEHNMGDLITAVGCEYAFYFCDSYHPNSFYRLNSAWCKFPVGSGTLSFPNIGSNQSSVHIQQLDIEWQGTSYGNWFDSSYTINDPTNHLVGYIEYQMVERSIGINNAGFSKNGATKIQTLALGINHLPLNGGTLEKYNATISPLLNAYNPNGNNGAGSSILLGTSSVEGNGNARISGTAFSGNDYRSQLQLQTTTTAGVWNSGIKINENNIVTIGGLAGAGNRQVVADASGNLSAGITQALRYKASVSQTGTSAPSTSILENTVGSIVWTRVALGTFKATLSGAFTANKTFCITTPSTNFSTNIQRLSVNEIQISTFNAAGLAVDGAMLDQSFLFEIYP